VDVVTTMFGRLQADPALLAAVLPEQSAESLAQLVQDLQQSESRGSAPGSMAAVPASQQEATAAAFAQAQARNVLSQLSLSRAEGKITQQQQQQLFGDLFGAPAPPAVSSAVAAAAGGVGLPGLHNGNVESLFPGSTALANNLLSSGTVPAAGVAAASLEGGRFAGLGLGVAAGSSDVPAAPSWALGANRGGGFGSVRGPLFLPEAALLGPNGTAPIYFVEDLSSGELLRQAPARAVMSIDALLGKCLTYAHYSTMADMWFYAAWTRKYILPGEVPSYAVYVNRMRDAFIVLSDAAGLQQQEALRAFLELDRRLRVQQHATGVPWHQAFSEAELCRSLVSLQLRLTPPPSTGGSGGTGSGGASGGAKGKGTKCFRFESPRGCSVLNCPYAIHHKCRVCQSADHNAKACPTKVGGADA
jgi:hypothetical protein